MTAEWPLGHLINHRLPLVLVLRLQVRRKVELSTAELRLDRFDPIVLDLLGPASNRNDPWADEGLPPHHG